MWGTVLEMSLSRIMCEEPCTLMDEPPCPFSHMVQARARAPGRALSLRGCGHSHSSALDAASSECREMFSVATGLFPLLIWFSMAAAVQG